MMGLTKNQIRFGIPIILLLIVFITIQFIEVSLNLSPNLKIDEIEVACEFGKFKGISSILIDIEQIKDNKQFCGNQNCTNYFQGKIDKKTDYIKLIEEKINCMELTLLTGGKINGR